MGWPGIGESSTGLTRPNQDWIHADRAPTFQAFVVDAPSDRALSLRGGFHIAPIRRILAPTLDLSFEWALSEGLGTIASTPISGPFVGSKIAIEMDLTGITGGVGVAGYGHLRSRHTNAGLPRGERLNLRQITP